MVKIAHNLRARQEEKTKELHELNVFEERAQVEKTRQDQIKKVEEKKVKEAEDNGLDYKTQRILVSQGISRHLYKVVNTYISDDIRYNRDISPVTHKPLERKTGLEASLERSSSSSNQTIETSEGKNLSQIFSYIR